MVDSMASSVEDYLIEGLSFKLNPGASYVTDRRSVSYYTAGSNIYQSGSAASMVSTSMEWFFTRFSSSPEAMNSSKLGAAFSARASMTAGSFCRAGEK